jgi:alkylation response protein AidB-like acyl-CoA dehydrogenase
LAPLSFFHLELSSRFCACTLDQWEEDGQISREAWLKAGEYGLLGVLTPEKYGGVEADILYSAIVWEEQSYTGCTGPGFALHSEICVPYIVNYGTEEQKERFLPKMVSGECISAIAMTEPGESMFYICCCLFCPAFAVYLFFGGATVSNRCWQ